MICCTAFEAIDTVRYEQFCTAQHCIYVGVCETISMAKCKTLISFAVTLHENLFADRIILTLLNALCFFSI